MNQTTAIDLLKPFVPENTAPGLVEWLNCRHAKLRVTNRRATKLGDYTPPQRKPYHLITVNGNLNPFSFLITLLHEMAHLIIWEKFRDKVKTHGSEWKTEFSQLISPYFEKNIFPEPVKEALKNHLIEERNFASSCTDANLARVLRQYDKRKKTVFIEEIPKDGYFMTGNRQLFKKGEQRRKLFQCIAVNTNKKYLFSPVAEVLPVENPVRVDTP